MEIKSNRVLSSPFPHAVFSDFLSRDLADHMLQWLEQDGRWGLRSIRDFYETYDLDLRHFALPEGLAFLTSHSFCYELKSVMEQMFHTVLHDKVDATAQQMREGQRIGVHTDYGPVGQSIRFLIQLNCGWSVENGGLLMLFDEEFPTETSSSHQYYVPKHGTGFAFQISPRSFHAVSRVTKGVRYTLCYSFRPAAG